MIEIKKDFYEKIIKKGLFLCYQCGYCSSACPLNIPVRKILRGLQLGIEDELFNENIWYCAKCKYCEIVCPRNVKITDTIHELRIINYEKRKVPSKFEKILWSIYEEGNPFGEKRNERNKWAEEINFHSKESKYILYACCAYSYDYRLKKVAKSLMKIFSKIGLDISIANNNVSCCGDVVYNIGEEGFLEELIQNNLKKFNKNDTIITLSPHCYNTFKNVYSNYAKIPNVLHYTEFLNELIENNKLKIKSKLELKITYHDPCYLSRYNNIYEEPRKILESTIKNKLLEMEDNKQRTLCCGGGGGLMWIEISERPSHKRIVQALETKASYLVTSCGFCIQNFEDSIRTKSIKELKILDIAEVVEKALK